MDIPPEIAIKSTIRPGSVYYFPEDTLRSKEPHYFIVVNIDPINDIALILVCASSKIEKVKGRRTYCPGTTLVEINPEQYDDFTKPSIVDCNVVFEKSINQIIEKCVQGKLSLKTEMDLTLVQEIRKGIIDSPTIERRIKDTLR